jgi:hypothetical protein
LVLKAAVISLLVYFIMDRFTFIIQLSYLSNFLGPPHTDEYPTFEHTKARENSRGRSIIQLQYSEPRRGSVYLVPPALRCPELRPEYQYHPLHRRCKIIVEKAVGDILNIRVGKVCVNKKRCGPKAAPAIK